MRNDERDEIIDEVVTGEVTEEPTVKEKAVSGIKKHGKKLLAIAAVGVGYVIGSKVGYNKGASDAAETFVGLEDASTDETTNE